ncbi:FadR/GntR family transcriptional regulator [Pseudarthrobacter sp. AB1]|uniref:FadR/GntR family transcriptional regulator n=1 Tax=Pseudarthrobacter sp. AB1 TaxID=2138309 RepID=UPI00186B5FCC|nr:FCD domain-containing protein [Pseudarthrobacter sp. AB1]
MLADIERLTPNRTVSVRIAEQILERIKSGEFPLDTKLPSEMDLARRFGVSRPSVREALGALQFVGYLDSVRGSGTRVIATHRQIEHTPPPSEMTVMAVLDLFEARLLVEPQVAALAARNPVAHKIDDAEALIEGMRLAVHEPSLHAETDLRIHRALAEICPNGFMRRSALELLDRAASPALQAARAQAWDNHALPPKWHGQHQDVLHAIRAGDAEAAATASWAHMASSILSALTLLLQDPGAHEAAINTLRTLVEHGPPHWATFARDRSSRGDRAFHSAPSADHSPP